MEKYRYDIKKDIVKILKDFLVLTGILAALYLLLLLYNALRKKWSSG